MEVVRDARQKYASKAVLGEAQGLGLTTIYEAPEGAGGGRYAFYQASNYLGSAIGKSRAMAWLSGFRACRRAS